MYIDIDDMMVYRDLDHLIAAGLLSEVTMIESDRHLYEGIFTPGGVVEQAGVSYLRYEGRSYSIFTSHLDL